MRRILSIALAAALLGQAVIAFAQDSEEPSTGSVLDKARAKYWGARGSESQPAPDSPEAAAAPDAAQSADFPFTPFQVSFVPGLSFPVGIYDVNVAAGMIGSVTRDVSGVQGSGIFNIARNLRGAQGAGVFNIADGTTRGAQGSGVFNMAGDMRGVQGAGVFNMADDIRGVQAAGVFNIADSVTGVQAAGVFNVAGNVKGVQIGIVNCAKYIDGAQIGLLNFAGNGIHALGVAYEPATSYAYAYWQTGTPFLYTKIGVGAPGRDWILDFDGAVASFGFGSRASLFWLDLDVDVSAESAIRDLHFDFGSREDDWEDCEGWHGIRPYPSIKVEASAPVGGHVKVFAGVKADVDVDALGDRVPEALKKGQSWKGNLFDRDFTVWPKWFFGLKMQ